MYETNRLMDWIHGMYFRSTVQRKNPGQRRNLGLNLIFLIQSWEPMDLKALQNGSDIRGVALEGVQGESMNLSPGMAARIAAALFTPAEAEYAS